MDEAIAPADFLEEDTLNRVIKEASVITWCVTLNDKDKPQGIVLDDVEAAYFTQDQMSLLQTFVSQRGGGFLMLYCEEPQQEAVTAALEALGLVRMDFHFDRGGAIVLMDAVPRVRRLGVPERALASLTPASLAAVM